MSHYLSLSAQIHFADRSPEVMSEMEKLERHYTDALPALSALEIENVSDGAEAIVEYQGEVASLEADEIVDRVKALGRLADRAVMVHHSFDDVESNFAIGPNEDAIRRCRLEDVAHRAACVMLDALHENGFDSPFGSDVGEKTIAQAFQALFQEKPWSRITSCYQDEDLRTQTFRVEGNWSDAVWLLEDYACHVDAGEPESDDEAGPDPRFEVVDGYDRRGILLELAGCVKEPELTRARLAALLHEAGSGVDTDT